MGWWHQCPGTRDSSALPGRDILQESSSSNCQQYTRRDQDPSQESKWGWRHSSAVSCCLGQEGITKMLMLGSDPTASHSSQSYKAMAQHSAKLREQSGRDPRPH